MAFTRQIYDTCSQKKRTDEGTSVLSYHLDPNRYYNCNPCRLDLGIVGGNNVSLYKGNMVDLESDLRGQTRAASHCPSNKYLPGTIIQSVDVKKCKPNNKNGLPCSEDLSDKLVHLPECKLVDYKPRPKDVGYVLSYPKCDTTGYTRPAGPGPKPSRSRKNLYMPIEWQNQKGVEQWSKY